MRIEKIFGIRLSNDELSNIKFIYDFDTDTLSHELLRSETIECISAIRIRQDSGLTEWLYGIYPEDIKKVMLKEHNIESAKAFNEMNDRRLGNIDIKLDE